LYDENTLFEESVLAGILCGAVESVVGLQKAVPIKAPDRWRSTLF